MLVAQTLPKKSNIECEMRLFFITFFVLSLTLIYLSACACLVFKLTVTA